MMRRKGGLSSLLLGLILVNDAVSWRINNTIYDTDARITYAPQEDFCVQWKDHESWRTCDAWAKPWKSEVYRSQGKLATLHRSLDHEQSTMTVNFRGSALWLYGPPPSQLSAIPVDHKICLQESHQVATNAPVCYRVDVAEAYSVASDCNAPVVIFAKGGLQDQEHQIIVSIGDPVDEVDGHRGIQFSHAVYTIDRPTPWPTDEDSWRFREVVMHDTHPLLSYWPKEPISRGLWLWSPDPSGWSNKTYTTEDGSRVSWHELQSRGESNQNEWGLDANITAGAVAIYGIAKAHITETDSLSDACVRINSGPCEIIDVKHAYLSNEHHHEAVLLWQNQALDPYKQTQISIRLVKTDDTKLRVFPFKAIHYFEQQEYSSPDPPVGRTEDVVLAHDNQAIVYHPGRRCVEYSSWWCTKWFDPWTWKEAGSSGSVLTYRSTVSSYRTAEDPSITLNFQGSAVYVYGAPKSFMKDGFASQHVCINGECHIVDTEQAYLNAPEAPVKSAARIHALRSSGTSNVTKSAIHSELDPVLIWSMTGLDDKVQHSLRLGLAGLPSNDDAEMSIAKVLYTKVTYKYGQPRPDAPVPQPDHTYGGPVNPLHAINWGPRPNPARRQLLFRCIRTPPPYRSSRINWSLLLQCILWPVLGLWVLNSLCKRWVASYGNTARDHERRPIRPRTPPPPYVPRPPVLRTPAPPPFQPRPPPRPNPPRAQPQPQPAPPPQPTCRHSASDLTGPSTNHLDPNDYRSKRPIPKSDLGFAGPQRTLVPSKPLMTPEPVKPGQERNNVGPCPGSNVAPPKPEYADSIQKLRPTSSEKTSRPATNALAPTHSASVKPLPPPHNAAGPIPDYRSNHSTPQAPSLAAINPTPSHTSPAIRTVVSPSRIPVDNVTHQSRPAVHPTPQVPPKPNLASSANGTAPPVRTSTSNSATSRPDRVVQPTSTARTPSAHTSLHPAPNPSQHSTTHQSQHQSTVTTSRAELSSPGPQESAYTPGSEIAQWAQNQGYRIDRLLNANARNEHARPNPGPRRNLGQARNAIPPFNPGAHDTLDPANADWREWRRIVEETGRVPPNFGQGGRGEVPATAGTDARRPRTNNQRSNQVGYNNGQR